MNSYMKKDGYYLSVYLEINKLANVYGTGHRHNQNLSLWKKEKDNVELIRYWELERITGLKQHRLAFYNKEQAIDMINNLLCPLNLSINQMVQIFGTPDLDTFSDYSSLNDYPNISYHSIAHLFSCALVNDKTFYTEKMLALSVDGGSDQIVDTNVKSKYAFSGAYINAGRIDIFPIPSPGILWLIAKTYYNMQEGSLMALESASKSVAYFPKKPFINKSMQPDHDYNQYFADIVQFVDNLKKEDSGILFNAFDSNFTKEENKISMVMKEIRNLSIQMIENIVDNSINRYGFNPKDTYLAMSGGFTLNCSTNSHLMRKYQFKGFQSLPCVDDSGQSLGIALYAFYKSLKNFNFNLTHAYYGELDNNLDIVCRDDRFSSFIKNITPFDTIQVVKDVIEYPIVWFNGASEIGPRALGNRSILSDPRKLVSKDIINRIKKRQWWRPVAPIILAEDASDWFIQCDLSPFMLRTYDIQEDKLDIIPAVSHLDNSARVQTVTLEENPQIYHLLEAFKQQTGVPILCNTSLNDKGEPIINRIDEAIHFALSKDIPVIYINTIRIELVNHDKYKRDGPLLRRCGFVIKKDVGHLKEILNPYHISEPFLCHLIEQCLIADSDLTQFNDVKALERYVNKMLDQIIHIYSDKGLIHPFTKFLKHADITNK